MSGEACQWLAGAGSFKKYPNLFFMTLLPIILCAMVPLVLAYRYYGGVLSRWFRLDPNAVTPAEELRDDVDYVPIEPKFLVSQHFSAIAAAGPIVGPVLAGLMFGWLPALLWILVGAIFIGGVHDFASLVASVRHRARSIAEVVRTHISRRGYYLFLVFVWIALIYIVVAFTDIVAGSFVGSQKLENGEMATGAAIASSSLLYLVLPLIMGVLLRYTRLSLGWATAIFLPLVGLAIWVGPQMPFDLGAMLGQSDGQAQRSWGFLLLIYCVLASLAPMWLLLQPRGHLGGYFLYVAIGGIFLGIMLGGHTVHYPAIVPADALTPALPPLMPMLFITIACGACSGFHSIIASGTTCKQLRRETDARVVGYGSMLLEAVVAVLALACVMILTPSAGSALISKPNFVYAQGLGSFLGAFGIPPTFAVAFGLLAFTTFVYDTLDVCTRLGRYILQELFSWQGTGGRIAATLITVGVPAIFLMDQATDAAGNPIPAWRVFWPVFGASNQLLAALTLLGCTVWLHRTYRAAWVWWAVGLPTAWMYLVSVWALISLARSGFVAADGSIRWTSAGPVPWVAVLLVVLGAVLLFEAAAALLRSRKPPSSRRSTALFFTGSPDSR